MTLVLNAMRSWPHAALAFVAVRALSGLGSAVTAFALSVWVYEATGSYALFAALAAAAALPALLFAPVAGVIADRWSRRRVLILCDALAAAAVLAVLLADWMHALPLALVGAVTVTLALVRTLAWPAAGASLTALATPAQRPRVNGIAETLEGVTVVLSPLLGAALFKGVGLAGVAAADIATYLTAIAVVAALPLPHATRTGEGSGSPAPLRRLWTECLVGFRFIAGRPHLSRLLLFFALVNLGCSVFLVAYTPYVLSFAGPTTLAVCLGLGGTGTIVSGLAFTATGGLRRPEAGVRLGAAVLGAAMAVFGIARSPGLLQAAAFTFGAGLPLINASSQTIWQAQVPPELQGRVFSVRRMIAWTLNPLSVLLSIPLVAGLCAPVLRLRLLGFRPSRVWGEGPSGEIGLMVSACGALCLTVALLTIRLPPLSDAATPVPSTSETLLPT